MLLPRDVGFTAENLKEFIYYWHARQIYKIPKIFNDSSII
jgi:hypothetical protein